MVKESSAKQLSLIGVEQSEHRQLVGSIPVAVAEVFGSLLATLTPKLDVTRLWTAGPDIPATYHRNVTYQGYPDRGASAE